MDRVSTSVRLKEIMDKRGLRQVDVLSLARPYCEKYGVKLGKNDLSQYVSGKVEPGQDKLSILGMALDVSEAWLMGYDVPKEKKPAAENDNELSPNKQALITAAKDMDDATALAVLEIVRQVKKLRGDE